jgi:predicted PurR-regulated permease PerM
MFLLLAVAVVTGLAMAVSGAASQMTSGPESVAVLLERMADVVDKGQTYLPQWALQYLPKTVDEWKVQAADWLRANARHLSTIGKDIGVFLFHVLFGMLVGGMIALNPAFRVHGGPLAHALHRRMVALSVAFRRIVFSQIRISALNTVLTAIFLFSVEPLMGVSLPFTEVMIAVTFFAGLLPIIGNLISNTVIFLISLSVSPLAAVMALLFLIVIHKLEYFVNARIIGGQIRARAWEILLAMIAMEATFGIPGVVAAPIYYAYLKEELTAQKLI